MRDMSHEREGSLQTNLLQKKTCRTAEKGLTMALEVQGGERLSKVGGKSFRSTN